MTTTRNRLANLALSLSAVVIVLAVLELSLALFWPHKITARPFFHIQNFFCEYHPLLGWVNKPNYRGVVTVNKDLQFTVSHNSKGLRDREHAYERQPGTQRILVMGDSFMWGFGVDDRHTFSSDLESMASNLEVINMGVTGYGTDQELLYYTEEGFKYHPDIVILAFYSNDIAESGSSLSYRYPKPFFIPDSEPLTVTNVPVPRTTDTERKLFDNPTTLWGKTKKFLRRNTHTYPFLTRRLNSIPWLRTVLVKIGIGEENLMVSQGLPFYKTESKDEMFKLFCRLVTEFRKIAEENGARFLFINIPVKENSPGGSVSYEGITEAEAKFNDSLAKTLEQFTADNHIAFLNLLGPLRKGQAEGTRYYCPYEADIHFNEKGYRVMAETTFHWLQNQGWIRSDSSR